jgi:hypothetical protein
MLLGAERSAMAQSAASTPAEKVAMATAKGSSGEPWVLVYDVVSQRLAAYRSGSQGLELRGIRQVTWDLELEELPPRLLGTPLRVKDVRALVEKGRARAAAATEAGAAETRGPVILAASQGTSGEPSVYLYDLGSQRVASYRARLQGLELTGVRQLTWDLKLVDHVPSGRPARVLDVKKAIDAGTTNDE